MKANTTIGKIFAATLMAGAVTLGAVGFGGTASADGPGQAPGMTPGIIAPPMSSPATNPTVAKPQPPVVVNPVQYTNPYLYNGRYVYPYQYANQQYVHQVAIANQVAVANQIALANQVVYANQLRAVYSTQAVTASQFSFITATASVLGMNRTDVVVRLQQGRSLTSIAAERGVQRAFLFNAVVANLQGSINTAVAGGALNAVTGHALLASANNRAGIAIDQPGTTSGVHLGAIEVAYQLFN